MEPVWHGDVLCKQNSNVERCSSGLLPCCWVRQHAGRGASIFEAGLVLANRSRRVPGTERESNNKPTETANYWGIAWTVVGLLER